MRLAVVCSVLAATVAAASHHHHHHSRQRRAQPDVEVEQLQNLDDCISGYTEVAIVKEDLVNCADKHAVATGNMSSAVYEKRKCELLRLKGSAELRGGKCVCTKNTFGEYCQHLNGCSSDKDIRTYAGSCGTQFCANGGTLVVERGVKLGCKCPRGWSAHNNCVGPICSQQASSQYYSRQLRVNGTSCVCNHEYYDKNAEGECIVIKKCDNKGVLNEQTKECDCEEGYGGHVCQHKCSQDPSRCDKSATAATSALSSIPSLLFVFLTSRILLQ